MIPDGSRPAQQHSDLGRGLQGAGVVAGQARYTLPRQQELDLSLRSKGIPDSTQGFAELLSKTDPTGGSTAGL